MRRIRLLLLENCVLIREALRALLAADQRFEVVAALPVHDASEVIREADVVIADFSTTRDAARVINRFVESQTPVIVFASPAVGFDKTPTTAIHGWISKHAPPRELFRAILAIANGEPYSDVSDAVADVPPANMPPLRQRWPSLSRREQEVLSMVSQGHTHKAISGFLGVSVKTVETYRSRAATKLGVRNRADIVAYARGQGWLQRT